MLELDAAWRSSLTSLMATWVQKHGGARGDTEPRIEILEVEELVEGRPGILDVLANVDGELAHAVLGLRTPGEEVRFVRSGDDAVIGLHEDALGLGMVVDALLDTELAPLVLAVVTGDGGDPGAVSLIADDDSGLTLLFSERYSLTVFPWLFDRPHPGVELLVALDEAGFNHLAAPVALWRRGGRDLGMVQEPMAGAAAGWALALTSLRDLYAGDGPPEDAGGDFASEARALGVMTGRMHVSLERAFGRRAENVAARLDIVATRLRTEDPSLLETPGLATVVEALRTAGTRLTTIRTHGDFGLERVARTDQGWMVADTMPGGYRPGGIGPEFRSPLEDVADMFWSFHRVALAAALEREPSDFGSLIDQAKAWEARNRRAFLVGYLATAGIGGLVPADREMVRNLVGVLELERAAERGSRPGD